MLTPNNLQPARLGSVTRHWQAPISERRLLLMMGDVFAAEISVVVALDLWALHASTPFGVSFVLAHWYWFVALPVLWLVLASAYDYYDLRVAARARQSLVRLALIAAQTLAIYFIIFFLSPRGALPRRFVVY